MRELETLLATVERLRTCEAELTDLRARLADDTAALAGITDPEQRLKAGLHAYWQVPETNATEIARAVLGRPDVSRLLRLSPPHLLGVDCERCGQPVTVRSRAAANHYRRTAEDEAEMICARCSDLSPPKEGAVRSPW